MERISGKWLKVVISGAVIFCLYGLTRVSAADMPTGVPEVDQAKVRLSIIPGDAKSGTIKVENHSPEPKTVRVYLEDWVYMPACDGTKEFKPSGTTELSAANWISFAPSEFTVPPFGRQAVNYTVKVPADASGGHYAVLFFESYIGQPPKSAAEGGVKVNLAIRVASLFYIEAQGTVRREAQIEGLQISRAGDSSEISVNFRNGGNVDITTKGSFFIMDKSGMVYARGEFNPVYTFGGTSAILTSSYKELIPKGVYDLMISVDIGRVLEEAGVGRGPVITKEAEIETGDNGEILKAAELK